MKRLIYLRTFIVLALIYILTYQNNLAQRYWNTAAKFDSTNSILVAPFYYLQHLSGSFTVECWVNIDPGNSKGSITLFGKNSLRLMLFKVADKKYVGRMQTGNATKLFSRQSTAMDANKWYHLACTYDSTSGRMAFYINGSLDTSIVNTGYGAVFSNDSLIIGNSVSHGAFKGMLDDIRIWNRPLTSLEIHNNMRNTYADQLNAETGNFGQGLVMAVNFDYPYAGPDKGGLYIYDGYNSYTNQGAEPVDLGDHPSVTTIVNSSLDLTANGYAYMSSNPDVELNRPVTVEAWVYPLSPGNGAQQFIVGKGNDYQMYLNNGYVDFNFNGAGSSKQTIPVNKWTHVAITCDSKGTGKIYLNGKLDNTLSFGNAPLPGNDTLFIGASSYNTGFFNGYIDAVKISNYEKSEDEINKDLFRIVDFYNSPQPPKSTVSINFDFADFSSTNSGGYYYFGGYAKNSIVGGNGKTPVSPIIGNNVQSFDEYKIRNSGKRIPQTNSAGYMEDDSLEVPSSQTISTVQLFMALDHENLPDLQIYLQSPTGDSVLVWNQNYGYDLNVQHIITVFDDNADSALVNGRYVDFGPYIKPANPINSVFSGKDAKGIWKLKILDLYNGAAGYLYAWGLRINSTTDVKDIAGTVPKEYKLEQNYPNPFNPSTLIKFSLPKASFVNLTVYDILGREVKTLVDKQMLEGNHEVELNGNDLPSGVYIYSLKADNHLLTKKMLLLK